MLESIISFIQKNNLDSITIWVEIVISSILLPLFFEFGKRIIVYVKDKRPLNSLLSGYVSKKDEVLLFLSQLSAVTDNIERVENQKYIIQYPEPTPREKNHLSNAYRHQIDPVWSEGDGECLADIYNVLGRANKSENIKIASTVKDWSKLANPTFSIGFNPKTTEQLMKICNPIFFRHIENDFGGHLEIDGHDLKLNAFLPDDPSIVQKTYYNNTPIFLLAGLGTAGTSSAGYFLKVYCRDLGRLYGDRPFCALLLTNTNNGRESVILKAIYPYPKITNILFHPFSFYKFAKMSVFPRSNLLENTPNQI